MLGARARANIEIRLEDFFGRNCANPLCFAEIGEQRSLVVVDCHYAFDDEIRANAAAADTAKLDETLTARARLTNGANKLNIAPDSIRFYVFEQIELAKVPSTS